MIKRRHFVSIKVAHNNNTGQYSYWNGIFTSVRWFDNAEDLVLNIRSHGVDLLSNLVERDIEPDDVEILCVSKL